MVLQAMMEEEKSTEEKTNTQVSKKISGIDK
jgi:hypothetical protein